MLIKIKNFEYFIDDKTFKIYSGKTNKYIKPYIIRRGKRTQKNDEYLGVGFMHNGKSHRFKMHRLIAEIFIPNPFNYKIVDHINGDTKDNRIENLRWVDNSTNILNNHKNRDCKAN